ncbi:MAG: complex I subunit 5 family protein [Persicimonas sp.]
MEAQPWVIGCIVTPLFAALISIGVLKRTAHLIGLVAAVVTAVMAGGLVWQTVASGPLRYSIGGWGAPLGIDLYVDGLAASMVAVTAVVGLSVSIYALGYFSDDSGSHHEEHDQQSWARNRRAFWALWLILWGGLNALFVSGDLFNLYVTLELMGLTAVGLIALGGQKTLGAAMRYLLVTLGGSIFYLSGVALLYTAYGTLDLAALGILIEPDPAEFLAAALITAGMFLKTALVPLHFWLPPAHAKAYAPVSAVLSALVIKASFYILLRLWVELFPGLISPVVADMATVLGISAIVWGSVQAIRQERVKMLVAYSTVAQVGYLFVIFSPAVRGAPGALAGGVYHALSHACAKAAMFMAAGTLVWQIGEDTIESLRGMQEHVSLSMFAFALAGISLMGLPPSGGFVAKLIVARASIEAGQWVIVAGIFAGGLLAAIYVFKVLRTEFISEPDKSGRRARRAPWTMQLVPLVLALVALALGLVAWAPLELLSVGEPLAVPTWSGGRP